MLSECILQFLAELQKVMIGGVYTSSFICGCVVCAIVCLMVDATITVVCYRECKPIIVLFFRNLVNGFIVFISFMWYEDFINERIRNLPVLILSVIFIAVKMWKYYQKHKKNIRVRKYV